MPKQSPSPNWQDLALGTAITEPGSAQYQRTGDWHSSAPVWNLNKCIKCGVCAVFCPEGCIAMHADGYPESDMEYCKGCAICVCECWAACIDMVEERE